MSTFTADPASFSVHANYVKLLKNALRKVSPAKETKFIYVKAHKFAANRKGPLLVADFDTKLPQALLHEKIPFAAQGVVKLTANDELDFTVKLGRLQRKFLKRYLAGLSKSIKPVFVTDADEDDPDAKLEPNDDGDDDDDGDDSGEDNAQGQAQQKARPKPLPVIPPELLQRIGVLQSATLHSGWEAKKHESLKLALQLIEQGKVQQADQLLVGLESKMGAKPLPTRPGAKPLPQPDPVKVAAVERARATLRAELDEQVQDEDEEAADEGRDDDGESSEEADLESDKVKKAALSHATSLASAQQRLLEEENAFAQRKTAKKSDKIKVSDSQTRKAAEKAQAEEDEAIEKAKAHFVKKREREGESRLDTLKRKVGLGDKPEAAEKADQPAADEKASKDDIDHAQALKKTQDEIDKFTTKPMGGVKLASMGEKAVATGIDRSLALGGSDIATAAGSVGTSAAAAASNLATMASEFYAYAKTSDAEESVHLNKALEALGSAFGNIVNITKGSLTISEHAGAVEAGSAVPILGIVAAVPSLLSELNHLRSAMWRLKKQKKVYKQLHQQVKSGDTTQETLHDLTAGFMARDKEAIGKNIARVLLDFTKIAGHGVTLGGITGPIGAAIIGFSSAGKLTLAAIGKVETYVEANKANDRRKKLTPTLNASADWKDLRKAEPGAKENVELTQALQVLDGAPKGTPAHAQTLEVVIAKAKAAQAKNAGAADVVAYAKGLVELAEQEKARWKGGKPNDAADDDEDPLQRNARKLAKHDPRIAAQMLIDQAQREGQAGGPAFKVLKSFGIDKEQVFAQGDSKDDQLASNREMRQKVLYKLDAPDKNVDTLSQSVGGAKDTVVDYVRMGKKDKEMRAYRKAKNLLQHGGEAKRGAGWRLKMNLLTDDVEEKKEALLEQVDHLLAEGDIDVAIANKARELLKPRKEKPVVTGA